jgi:hypothetical protein
MPMWRCPHCGTPQAETSRCWVCKRSSTSCGTCRHFRRSVAGGLGYCGLDRRRTPLNGDEIRACWEAASATEPATEPIRDRTPSFLAGREGRPRLEFVPVESAAAPDVPLPPPARAPVESADGGLWADLD